MSENDKVLRQNRGLGPLLTNIGGRKGPLLSTPPAGNSGAVPQRREANTSRDQGFDPSAQGFSGWGDLNSRPMGGNQSRNDEGNRRDSGMKRDGDPKERDARDFKKPKQDYEEPPSREMKNWSAMKEYNDDHNKEWFASENARLGKLYGEGVITVTYIESQGGRVGYACKICLAEMNGKKSLELHCSGMKHLKKRNLWEKNKGNPDAMEKDEPHEERKMQQGIGRGGDLGQNRGGRGGPGGGGRGGDFGQNRGGRGGGGRGDFGQNRGGRGGGGGGDFGQNRGGGDFGQNRGGRGGGDSGLNRGGRGGGGGDFGQNRGGRGGGGADFGRNREGGEFGQGRDEGDFGGRGRGGEGRGSRDQGQGGRGWDDRRRDDYDDYGGYRDSRYDDYDRPPLDRDWYRGRGSPPRSYDDPYYDRRRPDSLPYDPYRSDPYSGDRYGTGPNYSRPLPPPPSISGGPHAAQDKLNTGATGTLLKKLSACSVNSEADAALATDVIEMLVKSLKEYNQKKGSASAVHLLEDTAAKINIIKALEKEKQPPVPPPSTGLLSTPPYPSFPPGRLGNM